MAAGPHPRRDLSLTPRLGFSVLGSVWPQAPLSAYGNFLKYGTVSCRSSATVQKLAAMNV